MKRAICPIIIMLAFSLSAFSALPDGENDCSSKSKISFYQKGQPLQLIRDAVPSAFIQNPEISFANLNMPIKSGDWSAVYLTFDSHSSHVGSGNNGLVPGSRTAGGDTILANAATAPQMLDILTYLAGDIGESIKYGNDGRPVSFQITPDEIEAVLISVNDTAAAQSPCGYNVTQTDSNKIIIDVLNAGDVDTFGIDVYIDTDTGFQMVGSYSGIIAMPFLFYLDAMDFHDITVFLRIDISRNDGKIGLIFAPLCVQSPYAGPVWYVATNGSDSEGDGSSGNPFATFQHAINMSGQGDTVLAFPGIYTGEGNHDIEVIQKQSIVIMSQAGASVTIIDLSPEPEPIRGFRINADDSSYHTIIDGLGIRFGNSYKVEGTAIRIEYASAIIRNCAFQSNSKSALYISSGIAHIKNCSFTKNSFYIAGGIRCVDAGLYIDSSLFAQNKSTYGGSIYAQSSTLFISNSTFSGDSAVVGASIYLENTSPVIANSLLSYGQIGEAIYCDSASWPSLQCSDIYGYRGGEWTGNISGQADTNGNFSLDPLFCDAADENYHITDNSPCAPANNGCGLQVGLFGVGCEPWEINLSTDFISFQATKGQPGPEPYLLEISKSGGGNLYWTASHISSWLIVFPGHGTTPSSLNVETNIDIIREGIYFDTIVISSPYAINTPLFLPVRLTLDCSPAIVLNPSNLDFQTNVGDSSPSPQIFIIENLCLDTLHFSLSHKSDWLTVSPAEGLTPAAVMVRIDAADLNPGTYYDTISVHADSENSPQTLPVQLILRYLNRPPYFDPPLVDTNIVEGDTLELHICAYDPDNDPLVCSCFGKPSNADFVCLDEGICTFSLVPDYSNVDSHYVIGFMALDSSGLSAHEDINLTVENRLLEVISFEPAPPPGINDILISEKIEITFNEAISQSSLPANLSIQSKKGDSFEYTYLPESCRLLIDNGSDYLMILDTISIRLEPALQDLAGYTLSYPYEWTLYTGVGVFPGDADHNGCVDERDILPLGIYWEMTGPSRGENPADLSWRMHPAHIWSPLAATFVDCDGSGIINSADICGITENWMHTHSPADAQKYTIMLTENSLANIDMKILRQIYNALKSCPASEGRETIGKILESIIYGNTDILPQSTALYQNYPNPFNPATKLEYALDQSGYVTIDIYDISGRKVKILVSEVKEPGYYVVFWDGTGQDGKPMPSGIYLYRLRTGQSVESKKMLLLK